MSTPYFLLGSRMRQRQQRARSGQRSAVSGQQRDTAARHLTPALSPSEAEREKRKLSTLNSPTLNSPRFTYTARGLGERGSGRDTQATGRVSAPTAEQARAVVRRAYPFADSITVVAEDAA